jgi:alginate O-acetyltransferase complex protein AlgJ
MTRVDGPPPADELRPEHVEAVFLEFLGRPASTSDVATWISAGSVRALLEGVLVSEEYAARRRRRNALGGDLTPEDVKAVFTEFLGRTPSPSDLAAGMAMGSVRALLDAVLASEEYAARLQCRRAEAGEDDGGPYVNCWTPELASHTREVGSISPDGVAIVGEEGHLFLIGGTNENFAVFRGERPMAETWLPRWRTLVSERRKEARASGRALACLVVPDKIAVYADRFPLPLHAARARPVHRLIDEARLPLHYPLDALRAGRQVADTFQRTDSHLTPWGYRLLAQVTIRALGGDGGLLDRFPAEERHRPTVGDLGDHFSPPVMELGGRLTAPSAADVVDDNWTEVVRNGGHIGTRRVMRRADAPDDRVVVVFGDSYAFGDADHPGLSWFLAQVFREVHFVWAPFGWDPEYLDRHDAGVVVCQTAERFIPRLPRAKICVRLLGHAALARRGPLGLTNVFADDGASY